MDLGIKTRILLTSLLPTFLPMLLAGGFAMGYFPPTDVLHSYTGIGLALLALACLPALRLSRSLEQQTGQLQRAIAALELGLPGKTIETLPTRELNQLALAINSLAGTLTAQQQTAQRQLLQSKDAARQHLQTAQVHRIELDITRQEALAASRIKHDFLAHINHEIRTPLNGILGFTHLLHKTALTSQQNDHLQTIHNAAESLLGMLNQALELSRIEAGTLQLESQPFNLHELIQECLSVVAPSAHEKQLELLSIIYRDTPPGLRGDPARIKQVLISLLGNAVKFTEQGSIVVRAMLEDESSEFAEVCISVQDSGIGLEPAELERLFQPFNLNHNTWNRRDNRMGLAIGRRLIELMGGEIDVESTPGEGARFSIHLSLAKSLETMRPASAILLGHRIAVYEQHALARQALEHQLVDCGLEVLVFDCMERLLKAVTDQQHGLQAINLAVVGVSGAASSDPAVPQSALDMYLQSLQQLGCRTLVLCPTTEQQQLSNTLSADNQQLLCKPACSNSLAGALRALLAPTAARHDGDDQAPATLPNPAAPRVLCVDDNPANLLLVQTLLQDMGARVTAVNSGYAALQLCAEETFELILMDIRMPGMDGRQASLAIRRQEQQLQRPAVPIVALTAHVLPNQKRSLLQAGMQDLLNKPISEAQLAQLLKRWTAGKLPAQITQSDPRPATELLILDEPEGLRLAGGKAELASDLLGMLLDSLEAEQQAIALARRTNNIGQLVDRVHRLLGATRYCGVPQLRAACQRCEDLLRQDAARAGPALVELDQSISRLLAEARQIHSKPGQKTGNQ